MKITIIDIIWGLTHLQSGTHKHRDHKGGVPRSDPPKGMWLCRQASCSRIHKTQIYNQLRTMLELFIIVDIFIGLFIEHFHVKSYRLRYTIRNLGYRCTVSVFVAHWLHSHFGQNHGLCSSKVSLKIPKMWYIKHNTY